ncbi:SUMO-activating enzyme subunit 2 [Thecamonas trahens ATCC 50062]|uniref:SUMO-activating enzyme subunit n=1 Tax=Thecamonas trahens ATCC 50062 TaxID=461836 RepID=A0A0L0DTN1_THETB|nr:SUMO-activating enzyme subunit 2 [Thecamonas trahens ATCC 50062]KNC55600.1 SUMO-activating enzyme subunit 2 [Thecamonas trahens ATCC 50062]|eukprot:XP_013761373.1 SUMO-activating enzyme subunit 2 [Thecamonas trahens ATCC 50062]
MLDYSALAATLGEELLQKIRSTRVLMVGTGGIGCELLKNLVAAGFANIECIDFDAIDVSNLNRQFLFRKAHVGRPKSEVARESALRFNPDANIVAHCGSIFDAQFGTAYFSSFGLVFNALDNLPARRHVNRLCLSTNTPLIESGTAGYLGQVTVIRKDATECFECQPKPTPKTYPVCTIRTTPSAPIHCIVWAKYMFAKVFGAVDDDDVDDDGSGSDEGGEGGDEEKVAMLQAMAQTRKSGAQLRAMDAPQLFDYLFSEQIASLLAMDVLWKTRTPPQIISWAEATGAGDKEACEAGPSAAGGLRSQKVWSVAEAAQAFAASHAALVAQYAAAGERPLLSFDKDAADCMRFVTALANLRARCFSIAPSSEFDAKAMAGNIIPAIATTNAIAAGLMVVEAVKLLREAADECRTSFIMQYPTRGRKARYLNAGPVAPPNPQCFVCQAQFVTLAINTVATPLSFFVDAVLRGHFALQEPSIEVGSAVVYESGEGAEDMDDQLPKMLDAVRITDSAHVSVTDYLQDCEFTFVIAHDPGLAPGADESDGRFRILRADHAKRKREDDQAGEAKRAKPNEEPTQS